MRLNWAARKALVLKEVFTSMSELIDLAKAEDKKPEAKPEEETAEAAPAKTEAPAKKEAPAKAEKADA